MDVTKLKGPGSSERQLEEGQEVVASPDTTGTENLESYIAHIP